MPAMSPAAVKTNVTTSSPHAGRIARLLERLASAGADAMLISNPIDVGYLTGFLGGDSYLLVGPWRPVVISDFRYQEELQAVKELADVHIRTSSMLAGVGEVLGGRTWERLAVQGEVMPVAEFDAICTQVGRPRVIATSGLVGALRRRKDESELDLIRQAIRIQEKALKRILPTIKPGQTELEVAAALEAEMKSLGSSAPGFPTIIAARANGSLPHYRPGTTKIKKNDMLLIDWGAIYRGYHGDMTRTFALGKWPGRMKEVYEIVLEAQLRAAGALAPGKTTHEVDAVARDYIKDHGFGDAFGHGLGHGMGMNGHEDPRLNPLYPEMILEVGDVVTVEPGIYLPGEGGVRIEDDYVITEDGAENLCSMKKGLGFASL